LQNSNKKNTYAYAFMIWRLISLSVFTEIYYKMVKKHNFFHKKFRCEKQQYMRIFIIEGIMG